MAGEKKKLALRMAGVLFFSKWIMRKIKKRANIFLKKV